MEILTKKKKLPKIVLGIYTTKKEGGKWSHQPSYKTAHVCIPIPSVKEQQWNKNNRRYIEYGSNLDWKVKISNHHTNYILEQWYEKVQKTPLNSRGEIGKGFKRY